MKNSGHFYRVFTDRIIRVWGGPASIPLVYKEAVDRYKWMTTDEFGI